MVSDLFPIRPKYGRHPELIIQARRIVKFGVDLDSRQVDVVGLEQGAVGKPGGAEQLRLRQLEQSNVGPVEDDPRQVHVGPADILFDSKRLGRHRRGS
jgi:hypothetical protein